MKNCTECGMPIDDSAQLCPYCGTVNRGLDLDESDGLYVCSNCERTVDTKKDEMQPENQEQSKRQRGG